MVSSFWTASAVLAVGLASAQQQESSTSPSVQLDNGIRVQGRINPNASNVAEFLGIPYAQPPLGDLRWAPPQAYQPPSNASSINATTMPPSCWQYISVHPGIQRTDDPEFMIGSAGMSEDCLTISVWTPATAVAEEEEEAAAAAEVETAGLPVLIWFYGGGFATGGTDVPYQIPTNWVERSQSHIVVVFNYRLNIFGFPSAAGLEHQNLGLMDQRLAVEWTQQNIAQFGGDPARMVIWGQSAGSTAVDFYNFAYPEDPIVTGLIMDSGTAHLDLLFNRNTSDFASFSLVAANVGCANATTPAAELECMKAVSAQDLEGFVASYEDSGDSPSINFIPMVDGELVFDNYTERAHAGNMSDLPAMIGFTGSEGIFLTTYNATNPDFETALEYSYEYFWCPATKTTIERLSQNRTTHRSFHTGNFTNISPQWWIGPWHQSELPLIFGTHMEFRGNSTPFEYALSAVMQDTYLAFLEDPVHGLDEKRGWPAYQGLGGKVMQFGDMSNLTLAHLTSVVQIEEGCRERGLL